MGASIDYLATLMALFKTLFDSPQLMITAIQQETKDKSEKGDLIRSISSVFNMTSGPVLNPNPIVEPETPPRFRSITKAVAGPPRTLLKVITKEKDKEDRSPGSFSDLL